MRRLRMPVSVCVNFIFFVLAIRGQIPGAASPSATAPSATVATNASSLPSPLKAIAAALGDRLKATGKERVAITGNLTKSGSSVPVAITYQLPNSARIDYGGQSQRSVAFDGTAPWASDGNVSEADADLLESLLDDSPEAMLYSVSHGTSVRLLTGHARMDDGKALKYEGPWATILQLVGLPASRSNSPLRQKHYYFDSGTGRAMLVRYLIKKNDGSTVAVETSRGAWATFNGSLVPGSINRSENGVSVLSFQAAVASVGPAANDGIFTRK